MITIHVQSVLVSLAMGSVVAVLYVVLRDSWATTWLPSVLSAPGLAMVIGAAVGYFCIGAAGVLAAFAILPIVALAAWIHLARLPLSFEPGWYYEFAIVAVLFTGAICLGAINRDESKAP